MDLPIYSNAMLRTGLQFASLDRFKGGDWSAAWQKSDEQLAALEGASPIAVVREGLTGCTRDELLKAHALLFENRAGAGQFRHTALAPIYRGQDCAPPEFIGRSIENLETWLAADSFRDIHPIERCALTITRLVDIWPFEFGNLTMALVFANLELGRAGYAPFHVQPEHRREFEQTIASAMTIEMQPLINAIFQTLKREMESGR